jgi:riboflavin kinase/FMN adenylyltransferase
MKIHRDIETLPAFRNAIVTLGTFDGVHQGHQKIIDRLNEVAREKDGESVLLTFWPHPRMVLQPDDESLKLLNTIDEKIELLEKAGLHHLIIAPFTREFSRMSYLDFIRDILVEKLRVKHLIVGHDHHFGKNREGSYEQLQECAPIFDFGLEQVQALLIDDVAISSSKIRKELQFGDLVRANRYLGYDYFATGNVIKGFQRGRELGYPTANVELSEKYKLLPADGIYAVRAEVNGLLYNGMASLGYNPTFENVPRTLEVNLFNFSDEIYGERIRVFFLAFIRKEANFATVADLIRQIDADKLHALKFFSNP